MMSLSRFGHILLALMGLSLPATNRGPLTTILELVILPVVSLADTRRVTAGLEAMLGAPQSSSMEVTAGPSERTIRLCQNFCGIAVVLVLKTGAWRLLTFAWAAILKRERLITGVFSSQSWRISLPVSPSYFLVSNLLEKDV